MPTWDIAKLNVSVTVHNLLMGECERLTIEFPDGRWWTYRAMKVAGDGCYLGVQEQIPEYWLEEVSNG